MLGAVVGGTALAVLQKNEVAQAAPISVLPKRKTRFGVSTYSFWQFKNEDLRSIETCIDLASEWGFDGIEILEMQMTDTDNSTLQKIKQRAFVNGLDLCGFSTQYVPSITPPKWSRLARVSSWNRPQFCWRNWSPR